MKIIVFTFLCLSHLAHAILPPSETSWDGYNNPFRMDANFKNQFDLLPLTGSLANLKLGWPASYWPNYRGSIAWRWNADDPQDFNYHSPTLIEALNMDERQINQLSPAEKYDLYVSRYDYPTVKKIWRLTSSGAPVWYGICHGVAPASIFHEEPEARTVINQEGIKITFYSSDIKGLISNHYARESDTGIIQIGKRCFPFGFGCSDINAGSFHIILSNKLGLSQTGFIADIDRNKQVWNHVAVSYQAEVLEKILIAGYPLSQVESRVKIKTVVKYAASIAPAFSPVIGSQLADYYIRDYQYYLDLDSQGNVIGGTWLSWDRPDFIWYKERDEFKNYWQKLNELIAD